MLLLSSAPLGEEQAGALPTVSLQTWSLLWLLGRSLFHLKPEEGRLERGGGGVVYGGGGWWRPLSAAIAVDNWWEKLHEEGGDACLTPGGEDGGSRWPGTTTVNSRRMTMAAAPEASRGSPFPQGWGGGPFG